MKPSPTSGSRGVDVRRDPFGLPPHGDQFEISRLIEVVGAGAGAQDDLIARERACVCLNGCVRTAGRDRTRGHARAILDQRIAQQHVAPSRQIERATVGEVQRASTYRQARERRCGRRIHRHDPASGVRVGGRGQFEALLVQRTTGELQHAARRRARRVVRVLVIPVLGIQIAEAAHARGRTAIGQQAAVQHRGGHPVRRVA